MTTKRRDDLWDDRRKVGRPLLMEREESPDAIDRYASAPGRCSRKSLIRLMDARAEETKPSPSAALFAAATAARKWQVRGRERPHPPVTCIAPGSIRGSLTPSKSVSGVAAAVHGFLCRIRAQSVRDRCAICATEVHEMRAAELCPMCGQTVRHERTTLRVRDRAVHAWNGRAGRCAGESRTRAGRRPSRSLIVERHARASSLGAARRPVWASGLTRARLTLSLAIA